MSASGLILHSPLDGWSASLEEAPDDVFAKRMLGDGVAIDPTDGTLHAPCDGTITVLPRSCHAVTLRTDCGAEILLHIGIDTVALQGEGFRAHVSVGQRVRTGDRLITFELDEVARRARSLLTPVLLIDGARFKVVRRTVGQAVAVGDFLIEAMGEATVVVSGGGTGEAVSRAVRVSFEHGIHARPAAQMAAVLRDLQADVSVVSNSRHANARSPVAMMSLGTRKGEVIDIRATGRDAARAVAELERLVGGAAPVRLPDVVETVSGTRPPEAGLLRGVTANRGLATGNAFPLSRAAIEIEQRGQGVTHEREELTRARAAVRRDLQLAAQGPGGTAHEIAVAHLALLDDPELLQRAEESIENGSSAGFAWRCALRDSAAALRGLSDPRMAERAEDLLDLEFRVLAALSGQTVTVPELPPGSILMANEMLPSQLTPLDAARIAGICLAAGGATSHAAIIAAALGIPMLVAAGPGVMSIAPGTPVILDADAGILYIDPPDSLGRGIADRIAAHRRREAAQREAAQHDCHTADGTRVEVFANLGSAAEARMALLNGAEGCGLLRTEFLFLDRWTPPDEAEQAGEYQQIAALLQGRLVTIRTLDAGGDKPIAYLPLPAEENPALGLRGVRTSLWRPELLRSQLSAILRVRPVGIARILLPMVTDVTDIRAVRAVLAELGGSIPFGVMIETPAAAVLAERIAAEADFLSIGTNDLTQYTLAMDRGHPDLAARLDGLHPAVLQLLAQVAAAGQRHRRGVAVCGGLASDPVAVPVLLGLGIHELSMVPAVIPSMKELIATLEISQCEELGKRALQQSSAQDVRSLVIAGVPALSAGRTTEVAR